MTFEDETEVRRTSVGAKVLAFGFAILAVLGSFWGIVWFIRAYVEAPRVSIPAPITLAARDSTPAPAPATPEPQPIGSAQAAPGQPAAQRPAEPPTGPMAARQDSQPSASGAISDRWFPVNPEPAPAAPAAAVAPPPPTPVETAPASLATDTPEAAPVDEVVETSVPTISRPAPLPRPRPTQTAAAKRIPDPPLPRPRPDGPAPQSVWTGVPTTDDRYPGQ